MSRSAKPAGSGSVKVWHGFVRATHWAVAALVLFNLFNETGLVHRYAGYAAAAVVAARLLFGLTRPRGDTARLDLPGWQALLVHLREVRQRRVHGGHGHNPAGMLMACLLWALVLALGATGWMTQQDAWWGEDWVIDTHMYLAWALRLCILGHWAGVIVMSLLQRENLLMAMVAGRKPRR